MAEQTAVVIRRWKPDWDGGKSLIALFPYVPADTQGRMCNSYEHIGQHSPSDYDYVISESRPVIGWVGQGAKDVEELFEELESLGYNLRVIRNARNGFAKRQEALRNP